MEMVLLGLRDSRKNWYWFMYLKGSPPATTLGRVGHQNNKSVPGILAPYLIRFPFIRYTHSPHNFHTDNVNEPPPFSPLYERNHGVLGVQLEPDNVNYPAEDCGGQTSLSPSTVHLDESSADALRIS